jgi:hypothetical protein
MSGEAPGRDLSFDDFGAKVGESFDVASNGGIFPLALEEARPLGHSSRPGGAFSLVFLGPADPLLPQAIYRLNVDGEPHDVFLVPIARDASGTRYEAIFN